MMLGYYNNKLMKDISIQPSGSGFQFGYGIFETILVLHGEPLFVEQHYERLQNSCSIMGIKLKLDKNALYEQTRSLSEILNIFEGRLKIVCFKDVEFDSYIMTLASYKHQWEFDQKGMSLCLSGIKRNPYSPLSYMKSLNYMENILARDAAAARGYDEAIFLNVDNKLCEGSVSNIFWVKSEKIYTPAIHCGILDGVTRRQVLEICISLGLTYSEGSYELFELQQADEVFITNSLRGIMPVNQVEDASYSVADYFVTKRIHQEYRNKMKIQLMR